MKKIKIFIILAILGLSPISAAENWWSLYFTSPGGNSAALNATTKAMITIIDNSKKYIHGAFFDIRSDEIADAFIRAHKRGVKVKLVTDNSNYSRRQVNKIMTAGITVVPDIGTSLMHNKFMVVDGESVWTGSMNITENCLYKNDNNSIHIKSSQLADIFDNEFYQMHDLKLFSTRKTLKPFKKLTNKYYIKIGDTDINAYFAPKNNIEDIIVKRINKAKKSVHFMAFVFTSPKIAEAMINKHKSGVEVKGIFEKRDSSSEHSQYTKMLVEELGVKLDRNPNIMHHKVIIIDGERLITGSYNFTRNAARRNDENVLMIDNKNICELYLKEFYRLYN